MARSTQAPMVALLLFMVTSFFSTATAQAVNDPRDARALRSMYDFFGRPRQLTGWSVTGDPCGSRTWKGVSCSGSRVESIYIKGLEVGGFLRMNLSDFSSLRTLDMSNNKIAGSIPLVLPPNAIQIDLSNNDIVGYIPKSISSLKQLSYLNVSNNLLIGKIGDAFMDMQNLEQLDLSANHLVGHLPVSFMSLTNLDTLNLQVNEFTGDISVLADLPLSTLNLENNRFKGCVPQNFESISDLRVGGNKFNCGFIRDTSSPSSGPATPHYTSNTGHNNHHSRNKWLPTGELIAIEVGAASVVVFLVIIVVALCCKRDSVGIAVSVRRPSKEDTLALV